jgi:hypothetical protein
MLIHYTHFWDVGIIHLDLLDLSRLRERLSRRLFSRRSRLLSLERFLLFSRSRSSRFERLRLTGEPDLLLGLRERPISGCLCQSNYLGS